MNAVRGMENRAQQKERTLMNGFPLKNTSPFIPEPVTSITVAVREKFQRKQIVSAVLLVIVLFQLVNLPGALLMHSAMDIGTVLLGLALCAVAALFNQLGKITIVSILLIAVIDLGCGLMLLASPMGLDVGDLPVFDVLLVSELIAVSLLPSISVFPVALSNILFILAVIALMPHTMALNMMLSSSMAYTTVAQPVSLQLVVAVVAYVWVRSALRALARADRAEEIARLQRREAELLSREVVRTQQLNAGSEHLLQVLVRAANGDHQARTHLWQGHPLWRVGNAVNLLLSRISRPDRVEEEARQLRVANARLNQLVLEASMRSQQTISPFTPPRRPSRPLGREGTPPFTPSP
jgi:hypothetical protein